MTYLGFPRLQLSGRFQADPSTVNNDPEHFDDATFEARYQKPGPGATNGWWNPKGTGAWRFLDCAVRSVVYRDGTLCDDPLNDPVVGMAVNDARDRVEGKLVDLDTEQQMVSEIWGFQILLGQAGEKNGFRSRFEVAPFSDIWVRYPAGQPDSFFSAVYQSLLTDVDWSKVIDSRFVEELAANGTLPSRLSFKFTVDGYNDDRSSPDFTFGRVVGVIGPYAEGEPRHFVAARQLRPAKKSPLNFAPARIDGGVLHIDLGNSLPTTSAGGPLQDLGPLQAAILPAGGAPVLLGAIHYLSAGWYDGRAGIQDFRLTPEQAELAAKSPLGVVATAQAGTGSTVYLQENGEGAMLRADKYVFRLDAHAEERSTFYATRFGQPASGVTIKLYFNNSSVAGQVTQGPISGPPAGTPESALTFPKTLTTDAQGRAEVTLQASPPGNPRGYIDGQVYGVGYLWDGIEHAVAGTSPANLLNVLVWDEYAWNRPPTWLTNVQPIFQQYANLYPVMKPIVDLAEYSSVASRLYILKLVFNLPVTDPNYMPVTRDLSGPKREMIRAWLDNPLYLTITTVDDLKWALQQAIELEHATIPTYLTALYSIKPGHNQRAVSIIRGIVIEEMLHMSLASNMLNAIGGIPQINRPGFVPKYPTRLPAGLRPDLTVTLKKCSLEQIRDVFMSIEEPETTTDPVRRHGQTIGWFYDEIAKAFKELSRQGDIFVGDPARQLRGWPSVGELIAVTDLESALAAIQEIVEQGEGASPINPDDAQHELAHFYRFSEIFHGRGLVIEPGGYSYTGAPIPFDPKGVWPMMDNPSLAALPPGSRAWNLSNLFNRSYQDLLNALNRVFNGHPDELDSAVGIMYSLDVAARQLMETPNGLPGDETAGPSFEQPAAS
jgi:hypothetical protein